jgi:TolB-like protein
MMLAVLLLAPTVAVMPFSDLSSSSGTIGEAIRETVTTDLKDVGGLRVIERARIDQVLAEQKLQESRADLDAASSARVGKLLGATLIVTGAYQKVAANVRLTARFVKVETGEIVGTAKVDGKVAEFLSLQDRVTGELLRSTGLGKSGDALVRRARPKIKSARTIELYGDAVMTDDVDKKKLLLQQALDEDPQFSYASRDLDALEKRLHVYDANARKEEDALIRQLHQELRTEKSTDDLNMKYNQIFGRLMTQKRWRRMLAECEAVRRAPPPRPAHASVPYVVEFCGFYDTVAFTNLRDYDGALRAGEKFVARYPTSIWFDGVRNLMESALREKREQEDGRKKAAADIAALEPPEKYEPCTLSSVYRRYRQFRDQRKYLEQCIGVGGGGRPLTELYEDLEYGCDMTADFACQRRAIEALKTIDPKKWEQRRHELMLIGRDD